MSPHFTEAEARIQSSCLAKGHLAQKGSAGLAPVCRGVGSGGSRKEPRRDSVPPGLGGAHEGTNFLKNIAQNCGDTAVSACPSVLYFLGETKAGQYGDEARPVQQPVPNVVRRPACLDPKPPLEMSRHSLPGGMSRLLEAF